MPRPGDPAPDFTAAADDGSTVSLAALRGRPVVLFFYPKDDTPGCTTEVCELRDAWADVAATGAEVLGVSPDTVASHVKFRRKFALPFRLLADPEHRLADAYGVWGEKSTFGYKYHGVLRTTFIIDAEGRVRHVFEKVRPKGHAAGILDVLRS